MNKLPQERAMNAGCMLALLLCPTVAIGQNAPTREASSLSAEARAANSPVTPIIMPAMAEKASVAAEGISYTGGQLRIYVLNSTLAEVLSKLAALTGVNIDIPAGASDERMPIVELGPGPARQILASLLSESNFDYLIQGAETDADKIQSVLLLPRGKKDGSPSNSDAGTRPRRTPNGRAVAAAPPEEAPAPEAPAIAQEQNPAVSAALSSPQPEPDQTTAAAQPDLSAPPVFGQPLQTNVPKTFPVPPPVTLDQQNISQQLQQMYQQRMQMGQQANQSGTFASPANK